MATPFASVVVQPPNPDYPRVGDLFYCISSLTDSATYTYRYVWYIGPSGSLDAFESANPALGTMLISSLRGFQKGHEVRCGIRVTDLNGVSYPSATDYQTSSNFVTLVNNPPTITGAIIQATTPRPGPNPLAGVFRSVDRLVCIADGAADIDDPVLIGSWPTYTGHFFNFTWKIDGVTVASEYVSYGKGKLPRTPAPNSTLTVPIRRGQVVTCIAQPFDGQDWGESVTSAASTIGVTAPITTGITLVGESGLPGTPVLRGRNATCLVNESTSADGDDPATFLFQYSFMWRGVEFASSSSRTVASPGWVRNDSVSCGVTAMVVVSDVTWTGDRVSSPNGQVVQNTPPITPVAVITPSEPTIEANLTCKAGNVTDADDDVPTQFLYEWRRNGELLNLTNTTTFTLPPHSGVRGDNFSCSVSSSDGRVFGDFSPATTVQIVKSKPILSNSTLGFDEPTTPTTIECVPGSVFDADGDVPDEFLYSWYLNGALVANLTSRFVSSPVDFQLDPNLTISCTSIARENVYGIDSEPVSSPTIRLVAPTISEFNAFSPSNKESVYTPGIVFNITFDQPVDYGNTRLRYSNGTTMSKSVIDELLTFTESLGADYSGQWTSASNLLITVSDVRGNGRPRIGTSRVSLRSSAMVMISTSDSLIGGVGSDGSGYSPVLTGNFGTAPIGFMWGKITGIEGDEWLTPRQFNLTNIGETLLGADTGVSHAFLWSTDLITYGIGLNQDNQLGVTDLAALAANTPGYSSNSYVYRPTAIDSLNGVSVASMASGRAHSLMLTDTGVLYVCGSNGLGQVGINLHGTPVTGSIAWTELRLDPDTGTAYATTPNNLNTTQRLWHVVEAGYDFSVVVRTPATGEASVVYAWGRLFGSIYNPTPTTDQPTTTFLTPQRVSFPDSVRIVAIAAGVSHVLFLTEAGLLYVWGRNLEGQLGIGSTPVQQVTPSRLITTSLTGVTVVSIAAGAYHSILTANTSIVYCFGRNNDGQCGLLPESRWIYSPVALPAALFNNTYAQSMSAGAAYTHFTNYGGDVYAFGSNEYGALGLADTYVTQPTYVSGLQSASITQVFSTRDISIALTPTRESPCLRGCNNHGSCFENACQCTPDWTGSECEIPVCASVNGQQCAGNGTCIVKNGAPFCQCSERFAGDMCTQADCSSLGNCALGGVSHGECRFSSTMQPQCACALGFRSPRCDSCEDGFADAAGTTGTCNTLDCSAWNSCTSSARGSCQVRGTKGQCVCNSGWVGLDCNTPFCTGSPVCSGHGTCITPTRNDTGLQPSCACDDRWTGTNCDVYTCAGSPVCSGQGSCVVRNNVPVCSCVSGFLALDCSIPSCAIDLNDCSGHGTCVTVDGRPACDCDSSYSGADCGKHNKFQDTVVIALIVVAVVVCVILLVAGGWFLYRRSYNRSAHHSARTGPFDPIAQKSTRIFLA